MPRHARYILPNVPLHIVQRGNNKQACFFEDRDFRVYLRSLETHAVQWRCSVHSYALMTNHVHILITPADALGPGRMMKAVAQNFTEYINRARKRTGSLWEGRFWSGMVGEADYVMRCQRYIELNPVEARMVDSPTAYPWTSYHANAGYRDKGFLVTRPEFQGLGESESTRIQRYREYLSVAPSQEECEAIEHAVKGGFAWGGTSFMRDVEQQFGPRSVRKRGPLRSTGDADSTDET